MKKTIFKYGFFSARLGIIAFFVNWVLNCGCDTCGPNNPDDGKFFEIYYDAVPLGGNSPGIFGINYSSRGFGSLITDGQLFSEPNNEGIIAFSRIYGDKTESLMYKNLGKGSENKIVDKSIFPDIGFVVVAPNSRKILFANGKDLYFFTLEGTGDVQFSGFCPGTLPSFSPDGQYFAFYTGTNTDSMIKLQVYSTGNPTGSPALVKDLDIGKGSFKMDLEIAWSPDSKSVVFTSKTGNMSNNIIIKGIEDGIEKTAGDDNLGALLPVVSPGLDSVCFVCSDGNIRIKNISNGNIWRITNAAENEYYAYPRWSPDGEKIMFIRFPKSGTGREGGILEAFNLKTGSVTILGNNVIRAFWNR